MEIVAQLLYFGANLSLNLGSILVCDNSHCRYFTVQRWGVTTLALPVLHCTEVGCDNSCTAGTSLYRGGV